jgi:hypothetical protein
MQASRLRSYDVATQRLGLYSDMSTHTASLIHQKQFYDFF